MTGIFDPAYYWLPLGAAAFILAIANLVRILAGKRRGCAALMFFSLACGMLTMLAEYQMIHKWVLHGDWSALMDVVPANAVLLANCVAAGILLNAAALAANLWRERKERAA